MPISVSVASRSGLSARAVGELALAAEHRAMDAFFVAESAADSLVLCQAALAATTSITVGTAVANARLRHPGAAAMATAALDEWSGGRFRIGLGVSNSNFNERVLGMDPVRPLPFIRDYVATMRRVLGEAVPGASAPLVLDRPPVRSHTPIVLAALLPRMLQLAGEVADGVVLSLTTPASLPAALQEIAVGLARVGRERADITVACVLPCCFDGDDAARRAGCGVVTGYARHPAAAALFEASGHGEQLRRIASALDRGEPEVANQLVDERMVDDFVLRGDPDRCAERVASYLDAGIDMPILFPTPGGGDWDGSVRRTIDIAPGLLPAASSSTNRRVPT